MKCLMESKMICSSGHCVMVEKDCATCANFEPITCEICPVQCIYWFEQEALLVRMAENAIRDEQEWDQI